MDPGDSHATVQSMRTAKHSHPDGFFSFSSGWYLLRFAEFIVLLDVVQMFDLFECVRLACDVDWL